MKPTQLEIQNALRILTNVINISSIRFHDGDLVSRFDHSPHINIMRTQDLAEVLFKNQEQEPK